MPTNFATGWPYLALLAIVLGLWFWERRSPEMVSRLEENIISALLAVITLVAFVQVVLRYGFNSGMQGALEFQRVMFAWLILFGMSYGVKIGSHLGVDSDHQASARRRVSRRRADRRRSDASLCRRPSQRRLAEPVRREPFDKLAADRGGGVLDLHVRSRHWSR
ncbi:MAG: TRAP transporter small permease subunit [Tepidamorphaceae bacterium]